MLFPEYGPEFYNDNDNSILGRMSTFYKDSVMQNQSFWNEADIDSRFEAGDQRLWDSMYGTLSSDTRKQFNFNRIRRVVNMISGWQRRNRKSTIVTPVSNGDSETSDQFSKVMMWANQREGILETLSESFHGALVTGLNLMQVWVDYRSDPVSGSIRVDNCAHNSFLIDPYFKKKDLSDCNGIWKRSYLTKQECMSLLPDKYDEIKDIPSKDSSDGKFNYMPESYDMGTGGLLMYDEFYYRAYRSQKMLVDSKTGETLEWRSNDEDRLRQYLRFYPEVTVMESEIPTVRMAIVVQGKVMYDGPNNIGSDKYPFVPVFGYYNPSITDYSWRLQGVVRGLRDAQYLYNRRKIIEFDVVESQPTGFIYKADSLVDPSSIFHTGQGRAIALNKNAEMTDIQQIDPPPITPALIQLSEIIGNEIQEISGVNEELLGSATDDKAGILSMLRQGSGLTTLQVLFDQLDRSQKLLGSLMVDVIQSNFTPGKIKNIIEDEPTPQFYNKAFGKYDAAVEEGVNTTTQRQLQFTQLLDLRERGINIPDGVLLDAATLQNKKELVDAVNEANKKQEDMQQLQLQVELAEIEARTKLSEARAVADTGLGLERVSRIEENEAFAIERRAEARKDTAQGMLNIVKAIKELDSIDIQQMQQLVGISQMLSEQNKVDKAESGKSSTAVAGKALNQSPTSSTPSNAIKSPL